MASRDLHNNIKVSRAISPAAVITGNAVTTSEIIDTAGFESLEFALASGVITDGSFTPAVYAGDAANMSDEVAVTSADELLGTIAGATFAAGDDNVVKKIGYRGPKRYVRVKVTQADATTGGFIAAVAIQGHPRHAPVA